MGITERGELILIIAGVVVILFIFLTGVATGYLIARRSGRKKPLQ